MRDESEDEEVDEVEDKDEDEDDNKLVEGPLNASNQQMVPHILFDSW